MAEDAAGGKAPARGAGPLDAAGAEMTTLAVVMAHFAGMWRAHVRELPAFAPVEDASTATRGRCAATRSRPHCTPVILPTTPLSILTARLTGAAEEARAHEEERGS
jgi:hypothetical protein